MKHKMSLSTKEVGKILGLSNYRVISCVKKGQIPTLNKPKKGKRFHPRFDEAEIRLLAPNFQKGAILTGKSDIQNNVELTLAAAAKPKKTKKDTNILHRIESKLDRLLEILE